MANVGIRALIGVSAVAAAMVGSSCSDGLGPIVLVSPRLDSLQFSPFYSRPADAPESGIIAVNAQFADTTARLRPNERIPVRVTVEGGDEETMMLEHGICFLPDHQACTLLQVVVRSGHTVDELDDLLSAVPARWWLISVSRSYGAVRVFDSRRVADALAKLRRHPAVASADRETVGVPGIDPPPHLPSQLLATLPLDYDNPAADDGIVQGQKGALITARYTQPDGTVLTHTIAIP